MKKTEHLPIKGQLQCTFENVETGEREVIKTKNMIVTLAKEAIASFLVGTTTNSVGRVTYLAVGTDGTAAALGDSTLGSEYYRKQISVREATNNQAVFRVFFNTSEANTTILEAGLFGDNASGTADSGRLYARTTISRTKTSSETLTMEWTLIIG